jgi:hypothetical protein
MSESNFWDAVAFCAGLATLACFIIGEDGWAFGSMALWWFANCAEDDAERMAGR